MAFDFKKEYKEFYMPKNKPEIVTVPQANYRQFIVSLLKTVQFRFIVLWLFCLLFIPKCLKFLCKGFFVIQNKS